MKELAKIRNDVVGSLLRPAELKQARQRYDEGNLSPEDLRQVEDREIRSAVRLPSAAGSECSPASRSKASSIVA